MAPNLSAIAKDFGFTDAERDTKVNIHHAWYTLLWLVRESLCVGTQG